MLLMPRKSKIVKIERFEAFGAPDFISGTYHSQLVVLNKKNKHKDGVKSHIWLNKKEVGTQIPTEQQCYVSAIKRRCEVLASWQYEIFLGQGNTQPKYYLIQEGGVADSVATKQIKGYKSLYDILKENSDNASDRLKKIFLSSNNLKLFSQMLVIYIWLAASDFKLDHIGIDNEGNLVCLDFGESLIPFQYQESAYIDKGWNFSITPDDLLNAPFFDTYCTGNFFITKAVERDSGLFDCLRHNLEFKEQLCKAILKKCIFPHYIESAGLELFENYPECSDPLKQFMKKRTHELRHAALQNPFFLEFIRHRGQEAYDEIKLEILSDNLKHKRYFRYEQTLFIKKCTQELQSNFAEIKKLTLIPQVNIENRNTIFLFALKHPVFTAGIVGFTIALLVAVSIFTCGAAVGVGAAIGLMVGTVHSEAAVAVGVGIGAGLSVGALTFFSSKFLGKKAEKNLGESTQNTASVA